MKLVLTRTDGKFITVDINQVKLIEPMDDGTTHLVFNVDLGRMVKETIDQINAAIGVIKLS